MHFIKLVGRLLLHHEPVNEKHGLIGCRLRQTGGPDFIGAERQTLEQLLGVGGEAGELEERWEFPSAARCCLAAARW